MDYTVIIPAYNEEHWLPATLSSLITTMAQTGSNGEIIVVDNNSNDRTAAIAEEYSAAVIFEPVNQISRARNTGARHAQGVYLIFLDADTIVSMNLLNEALRLLESGVCCGGGAEVIPDEGANRWAYFGTSIWNPIARRLKLASGCFIFCRQDAFKEIGGFSEKVYAGEEIGLSQKLKAWGKAHNMPFQIITGSPAITSGRKTEWYSPTQLVLITAGIALMPFVVRFRSLCGFWYRRPRTDNNSTRRK